VLCRSCIEEGGGGGDNFSRAADSGLSCVLRALGACVDAAGGGNPLAEAGVVDWRGCDAGADEDAGGVREPKQNVCCCRLLHHLSGSLYGYG
jgi:hypothetical protein